MSKASICSLAVFPSSIEKQINVNLNSRGREGVADAWGVSPRGRAAHLATADLDKHRRQAEEVAKERRC